MRSNKIKKILMFWCIFISIGAFAGGTCMLIDPTGSIMKMDTLLPYFQVLPFAKYVFQDYIFSGISLIIVNGISNLIAFILLLRNKKSGIILGSIFGLTLILWICIQFYIFPMNFMDIIYFIFGLLQLISGIITLIFYKQEHFEFDEDTYKNIGKDNTKLVVYFSRMNYTKKIAYEKADKIGANILEITSKERIKGTLGFWWCGRFGMHGWNMPINEIKEDLSKYKEITICSPIWVFHICSPIKTFINENKENLNNSNLILVHFNPMNYKYVFTEVEKENDIQIRQKTTICIQIGKTKYERKI